MPDTKISANREGGKIMSRKKQVISPGRVFMKDSRIFN
jgi:hypothetical protein